MTSHLESRVQQVPPEVQNLLTYVTGPEARSETAYTVELTLFRRLLALGAARLRLCLVTPAAVRPAEACESLAIPPYTGQTTECDRHP